MPKHVSSSVGCFFKLSSFVLLYLFFFTSLVQSMHSKSVFKESDGIRPTDIKEQMAERSPILAVEPREFPARNPRSELFRKLTQSSIGENSDILSRITNPRKSLVQLRSEIAKTWYSAIYVGFLDYFESKAITFEMMMSQQTSDPSYMPSRYWPENLANVDGWINYGIYLGLVFFIPIILAVVGQTFMCIACCVSCCLPARTFSLKSARLCSIHLFAYTILVTCFTIIIIIVSIYFAASSSTMIEQGIGIVERIYNLIPSAKTSINSVFGLLGNIFTGVNNLVNQIDDVRGPIQNIGLIVNGTVESAYIIKGDISHISANFSIIQEKASHLSGPGVSSPDLSGISIPQDILSDDLIGNLESIGDVIKLADEGVLSAKIMVQSTIQGFENSTSDMLRSFTDMANGYLDKGDEFMKQYAKEEYLDNANQYYKAALVVFIVVVCVIEVIFLVVLGICGIGGGILAKNKIRGRNKGFCLECTESSLITVALIYMIVAAVLLFSFFFVDDICREHTTLVDKALFTLKEMNVDLLDNLPGQLNISNIVYGIANCEEGTNFLQAASLDFESLNLTGTIEPYKSMFTESLEQFDFETLLGNTTSSINEFSSGFNLNISLADQIMPLINEIERAMDQYGNYSRFGFNEDQYNQLIVTLNQRVSPICNCHYVHANASDLYIDDPIYNGETAQWKVETNATKNAIVTLYIEKTSIDNQISSARSNVTIMKNAVENMDKSMESIKSNMDQMLSIPSRVSSELNDIGISVNRMKNNATGFIDHVLDTVKDFINGQELLECGYIGNFYKATKSTACVSLVNSALIGSIFSMLISILTVLYFPLMIDLAIRYNSIPPADFD